MSNFYNNRVLLNMNKNMQTNSVYIEPSSNEIYNSVFYRELYINLYR